MIKSSLYTIFHFIAALVLSYLCLVLITDLKYPSRWGYVHWVIFSLEVLALNYFLSRYRCHALPFIFERKIKRTC
jgi:hypothetical protein